MSFLVNYKRPLRQPPRLLAACALAFPPEDQREEDEFLRRLFLIPTVQLKPLLLLAGGFFDSVSGLFYAVARHMPPDINQRFDVFYREHDEGARMRDLLDFYAMRGLPTLLVGHSWGASSLVWDVVDKSPSPVDVLVTLDPVDWRPRPLPMPHVQRWINAYVDYGCAPFSVGNAVARVGRPWEKLEAATENYLFEEARHEWAELMFARYVRDTARAFAPLS